MSQYKAYIDGSYHFKSQTGGWGFVVFDDEKLINESFGQVPDEHKYRFEEYAFSKVVEFCVENKYKNITIYTDALNVERVMNSLSKEDLNEKLKFYIPSLEIGSLNIELIYTIRKNNKHADSLSRQYLRKLLEEERKNVVHQVEKNEKIEFFKTNKYVFCCQSMIKSTEKRVVAGIKNNSLIIELGQYYKNKQHFIKVMTFKNNKYHLIEEIEITSGNERGAILQICKKYFSEYKKVLLSISPEQNELYNELIGFGNKEKVSEFKKQFNILVKGIERIFIYEKNLTWTSKEMKPKLKFNSFDDKVNFYTNRVDKSEKALNKLVGFKILEFKKLHNRIPDTQERDVIKIEVIKSQKSI